MEELYQAINECPWMSVEVVIENDSKRVKYTDQHLMKKEHTFFWFSTEFTDHEVLTDGAVIRELRRLTGWELVKKWQTP